MFPAGFGPAVVTFADDQAVDRLARRAGSRHPHPSLTWAVPAKRAPGLAATLLRAQADAGGPIGPKADIPCDERNIAKLVARRP